MGLTDRGRAAIAAGVTLAVAGVLLGFEEVTRLGLFAVALVLLAAAFVAVTRPRVEVETTMASEPLQSGQSATFPLHITPAGRRSHPMLLDQPLPSGLGGSARAVVPALTTPQRFNLDLTMSFGRRGRHELPTCTLVREDPFGLASRAWTGGTSRSVTVYPRVHELETTPALGAGLRSDGGSVALAALSGDEHGSIRAYNPGDDLRRIHWPVTAHRGELMTRHDERASARHALLVLDPRLGGPNSPAVLEWGIEMLASAVAILDDQGWSFDLSTATGGVSGRTSSHEARDEALTLLALLPTASHPPRWPAGGDPFVDQVRDLAAHAGLVVLVAGTTDLDAARNLLLTLSPGSRGLAFLVAPAEATPGKAPDDGLVDQAMQIGWSAIRCTPQSSHRDAWHAATLGAMR